MWSWRLWLAAALLLLLPRLSLAQRSAPMFSSVTRSALPPDDDHNPTQLNYGVAVTDVDGDGDLEIFVAGIVEQRRGACSPKGTGPQTPNRPTPTFLKASLNRDGFTPPPAP
ncbi:unnamed protein product [Boreogadus saida]